MAGQWKKTVQLGRHGRIRYDPTRHQIRESKHVSSFQRRSLGLFCCCLSKLQPKLPSKSILLDSLACRRSSNGLTGLVNATTGLPVSTAKPMPRVRIDAAKATSVISLLPTLTETEHSDCTQRRVQETPEHPSSQTFSFRNYRSINWYHLTQCNNKQSQNQNLSRLSCAGIGRNRTCTSTARSKPPVMLPCCHPIEKIYFGTGNQRGAPLVSIHFRCYRTNPRKRDRNYYEVLDITPNATQAQVKEAFFKLSKVYHPDKNAGSKEAQRQFSSINEAYSVLGNVTLRKRYDRGTLNQKDIYGEVKEEETDRARSSGQATYTGGGIPFHEEAERQAKKMDAFFESHYKAALEKEQQDRADRQRRVDEYMELQSKAKHSPIILAAFIITAVGLAVKSIVYDSKVDRKLRAAAKGKD